MDYDIAKAIRPGIHENELVAIANKKPFEWGAERVMFVNSISRRKRKSSFTHILKQNDKTGRNRVHGYQETVSTDT